jgi:hypothetical protein
MTGTSRTNNTDHYAIRLSPLPPGPRSGIRRAFDRLFAADDAMARQLGWEVKRGRGGMSRVYHDKRFDRVLPPVPAADRGERDGH